MDKAEMEMKLHQTTHNMTTTEANKWSHEKIKEMGNVLISISANKELTHDHLVEGIEHIIAVSENNADKAHSDAGWAYENSRRDF